jgi:hypothetical protein
MTQPRVDRTKAMRDYAQEIRSRRKERKCKDNGQFVGG